MHSFVLSLLFGAVWALRVPHPPGPYAVAVKHIDLTDWNRTDALAPEHNTKRRIMASAYLPIDSEYDCRMQVVPYMPALTASVFGEQGESLGVPHGTLEQFDMEFCNTSTIQLNRSQIATKEYPIAVFSPGYQGTRLLYSALARSLASLGYIVFTLDHTYETLVVEFLDGTVAYTHDFSNNDTITAVRLETRMGDASFLISQLVNNTFTDAVFDYFPGTFNPYRVAVYGSSFGGSTAAVTVQHDQRVVGGLNLDGPIYGTVRQEGFHGKPFVLVSRDVSGIPVDDWEEFYGNVDAVKIEVEVRGIQHYGFMDVPLLLERFQVPPESKPTVDEIFGILDGRRVEKAINDVMVGLLDLLFGYNPKKIRALSQNPDLQVLHADLPECA